MNKHLEYIYSTDETTRVKVWTPKYGCWFHYYVEDLTPVAGVPGGRWFRDKTYWGENEDSDFASPEEAIKHARENVLR